MTREESETVECPYCGQKFTEENSEYDPETSKGVHISNQHTDTDESIPRKSDYGHKYNNMVESKWKNKESA